MARVKVNSQISEEAAEWLVDFRLGDIDAEGRRAFDAWVRSSPEHLRAFIEIAAIWNEGNSLDAARELDLVALVATVNAGANVVSLTSETRASAAGVATDDRSMDGSEARSKGFSLSLRAASRRRSRRVAAAASILLVLVGAGFLTWSSWFRAPIYSTAVGEKRTITLADGSTVALDSHTRLQVRFTDSTRLVELQEGQALFHVAKNTARPFIVKSGDTQVRAVGTAFDVYRQGDGTVVTVVEGRVAVLTPLTSAPVSEPDSAGPERLGALAFPASEAEGRNSILLSAGEQLRVTQQVVKKADHPNIASATAWTESKVVFDSAPLVQVAEEFNRYSMRKLTVEDSGTTPLRLSGVFTTSPDFLISYLRERPDITIVESGSEIHIIRRVNR
jgi:transmembrane sensor